jgi:hypothetical protein
MGNQQQETAELYAPVRSSGSKLSAGENGRQTIMHTGRQGLEQEYMQEEPFSRLGLSMLKSDGCFQDM